MKPNLFDGDADDIRRFVANVTNLAIEDYRTGNRRNGLEIVTDTAGESRIFHQRMATGIYNMTRNTLELMDRDRP